MSPETMVLTMSVPGAEMHQLAAAPQMLELPSIT
jgi:hypothetical protein